MDLSDVMQKPRRKVDRAKRHISELERETNPLSRDLYELKIEINRSRAVLKTPDEHLLRYKPLTSISEHFGAVMGDAVNNLREALDYWINMALQTVGPKQKAHFPFAKSSADLNTSKAYKDIQVWFPQAANFIATIIQPCFDQKPNLWAVTSLSNYNKHNDFLPSVGITTIENVNVRAGGLTMQSCSIGGPADQELNLIRSAMPIHFSDAYNTKVELHFAGGTEFDGTLVTKQMTSMMAAVSGALDDLEGFIAPYCE